MNGDVLPVVLFAWLCHKALVAQSCILKSDFIIHVDRILNTKRGDAQLEFFLN